MNALKLEEVQQLAACARGAVSETSEPARWMKVRVRRDGQTVVEMTHAASAVDRLSTMLDEAIKIRIAACGIDLVELASDARQRGYRSGPLFAMREGTKDIDVWLE